MPDTPLASLLPAPYRVETASADRFNRYRFTLFRDGERLGTGTHFRGGNHIKPWIEFQPDTVFSPDNAEHQRLFDTLAEVPESGSHIMVHYLQDLETADALTADVPPPATPLGLLLWNAGVRWYKDWYFTEGWMEGDQKLQGNLPLNADVKEEREQEWRETLGAFVNTNTNYQNCQKRAQQLLKTV